MVDTVLQLSTSFCFVMEREFYKTLENIKKLIKMTWKIRTYP